MSTTKNAANPANAAEIGKQIEYLLRPMKAPRISEAAARLAEQAREGGWSHEEYLAAVLDREVCARDASGARLRIRAAGFGTAKTIEDFAFDHQPGLKRDLIAHLATGTFLAKAENVVVLGPPGTGKTHLAVGLGIKAAQAGHRVLFATATEWVTRLQAAHAPARTASHGAPQSHRPRSSLSSSHLHALSEYGYITKQSPVCQVGLAYESVPWNVHPVSGIP